MKHAPVIEAAISRDTKEVELWEAYQKELVRLEKQTFFLHHNVMGLYIRSHDHQIIDFLTRQKQKLIEVREANDEFIKLMLRNKKERIEKILSD